jgi:hypothetical protein
MTQEQNRVDIVLGGGEKRRSAAAVHGNNAAWICVCNSDIPLIGRTKEMLTPNPKESSLVECPRCARRYFVVPADKPQGVVIEVRQMT